MYETIYLRFIGIRAHHVDGIFVWLCLKYLVVGRVHTGEGRLSPMETLQSYSTSTRTCHRESLESWDDGILNLDNYTHLASLSPIAAHKFDPPIQEFDHGPRGVNHTIPICEDPEELEETEDETPILHPAQFVGRPIITPQYGRLMDIMFADLEHPGCARTALPEEEIDFVPGRIDASSAFHEYMTEIDPWKRNAAIINLTNRLIRLVNEGRVEEIREYADGVAELLR